ncbi:MAG TPA: 50S ribosomal protein L18 [Thermodesulfobacteriota bacterium]|nr:50S ribosomal protein L18 [Thermodesulfobacteriota bacterium]
MIKRQIRKEKKDIRHRRIRRKLEGTPSIPRLSVFKSLNHIYAQIIDDTKEHTLVAVSSLTPEIREKVQQAKGKVEVAKIVGDKVGELALSKGIKKVCFDRGGYVYHGRVKALAEGARGAGLEF